MSDRIELRGLRAVVIVGANPEERERPQPIEVDLDVEVDLSRAGRTDDLADTVDYGRLSVLVVGTAGATRAVLLERLAHVIADEVLAADARIEATSVTVRKLRPPLPVDALTAAVSVTKRRASPPR